MSKLKLNRKVQFQPPQAKKEDMGLDEIFERDIQEFMSLDPISVVDQLDKMSETFMKRNQDIGSSNPTEPQPTFSTFSGDEIKKEEEDPIVSELDPMLSLSQTTSEAQASYSFKVPDYIKEELALDPQVTNNISNLGKTEPVVGIIIYVGSPVDGEVIVGNPDVVNDWLTYIRAAQQKNLVQLDGGLISSTELEKLNNVVVLPGNRHKFSIGYDIHSEVSCGAHRHLRYLWRSPTYPCAIASCGCPQSSNYVRTTK